MEPVSSRVWSEERGFWERLTGMVVLGFPGAWRLSCSLKDVACVLLLCAEIREPCLAWLSAAPFRVLNSPSQLVWHSHCPSWLRGRGAFCPLLPLQQVCAVPARMCSKKLRIKHCSFPLSKCLHVQCISLRSVCPLIIGDPVNHCVIC